ncbi:MAG: hypothetical protein ACWA40_02370 [Planktomarina sp.]
MKRLLFLLFIIPASGVQAQNVVTGPDFDALTLGKNYDFAVGGRIYGRERYLPGRRVIWDTLDGRPCKFGHWRQMNGDQICFVYEDQPDVPKCWTVYAEDYGVRLSFENDPLDEKSYYMIPTNQDLVCTGPFVGS